ncbi:hypothetical protein Tco_1062297 [Tanacetum coccineum]
MEMHGIGARTTPEEMPTANKTSASVCQVETSITPPSNTSVEMPRVESVRPSRVIIEDWISDDTEVVLEEEEPTELVEDQVSAKKGEKEVSTVGAKHSTVILEVSTAA